MMTGKISLFDFLVIHRNARTPMQWCVILIGLSIPISVAFDNVLLAIILLGALFSLGSIWRIVLWHPVARAAILLFGMLTAAMFYGVAPLSEAIAILGKYIDLMFIPIFIFLLSNETVRRKALYAFLLAMAITLVLSYLIGMNVLPVMSWMNNFANPSNPVIFHSHITQNNMMAFATFLALLEWREAANSSKRIAWGVFAVLSAVNVLFMVQGRTGYLILLALLGLFSWTSLSRYMHKTGRNWGWRQGASLILIFIAATFLAYHISARMHDRVALVISEYQAWQPDHGRFTSTGQRLDFYSNTLQIVREHPLLGMGTGGFPAAFAQQVEGKVVIKTQNPHDEYLMISVQIGLVGLALLLYLYLMQWRYALSLPTPFEQDAVRGLVFAYIVNCTFNSALLDHSDGLFFAFMTAVLFSGLKSERHA